MFPNVSKALMIGFPWKFSQALKEKIMFMRRILFTLCLSFLVSACSDPNAVISASDARKISETAYLYAYPMENFAEVVSASFIDTSSPSFQAPVGKMHSVFEPTANPAKAMKGLTLDIPYNVVFLDLRDESYVVTLPPVENNRYYSVEIIDMYTHIPSYLGTRQDGTQGGNFLIAGPRFKGDVPSTIKRMVQVDTDMVLLVFRTLPLNAADTVKTKAIQNAYKVQTFNQFSGNKKVADAAPLYWPSFTAFNSADDKTFSVLSDLLRYCPVLPNELGVRADFSSINIFPGEAYDTGTLPTNVRTAITSGIYDGKKKLAGEVLKKNDFPYTYGKQDYVGTDYLKRAAGATLPVFGHYYKEIFTQPIMRDDKKKFLSGMQRYRLTFKKDNMPPFTAFWSLSLFDKDGNVFVNPKKRNFISPMMKDALKFEANGDLVLYIQKDSPGKDKEANWLPAPNGVFTLVFSGYLPSDALIEKQWQVPILTTAH